MDFSSPREMMAARQLQARGIKDKRVLAAFRKVPRDLFIPQQHKQESYEDHPVSIGSGQTISQPYMVALMTELLNLKDTDRVLEIGTGSGYQTAILAQLCLEVYTVERITALAEEARRILTELDYTNINVKIGDGSCGWGEHAPYNGIIVTCAAPSIPQPLIEQLSEGGRLVIPTGTNFSQVLTLVEKEGSNIKESQVCACVFVPLVGRYGWNGG
jgi:protein-L-isoaspartate(D-aspartate) O-methyltransferase